MSHSISRHRIQGTSLAMFVVLFALIIPAGSCNKADTPKSAQKTFASPTDAGAAFFEAAKSGDQDALLAIFGPDAKDDATDVAEEFPSSFRWAEAVGEDGVAAVVSAEAVFVADSTWKTAKRNSREPAVLEERVCLTLFPDIGFRARASRCL